MGEEYTPERLVEQIAERQKFFAESYTIAEVKAPTPSKPIITPTQPTTPKTNYVYKPPTDDEFYRAFGIHLDEVVEPKPTESKAPEKKEDVWAGIRGIRDSDKMIADLEAGGITSLDDLRSFFWNIHHDDDHTDELAVLDKKIKGIDKLLAMMKQRSDNSAKYKEYQGRSAFTQKSFRKKNAAAIDDYEKADKYIKEHIKNYLVDGKAPKRSELEQRLIELKSEYNALVPEHNAFIRRQNAASQYTRQVRNYLQSKEQQERDRQYQERKRTQQRKKNYVRRPRQFVQSLPRERKILRMQGMLDFRLPNCHGAVKDRIGNVRNKRPCLLRKPYIVRMKPDQNMGVKKQFHSTTPRTSPRLHHRAGLCPPGNGIHLRQAQRHQGRGYAPSGLHPHVLQAHHRRTGVHAGQHGGFAGRQLSGAPGHQKDRRHHDDA